MYHMVADCTLLELFMPWSNKKHIWFYFNTHGCIPTVCLVLLEALLPSKRLSRRRERTHTKNSLGTMCEHNLKRCCSITENSHFLSFCWDHVHSLRSHSLLLSFTMVSLLRLNNHIFSHGFIFPIKSFFLPLSLAQLLQDNLSLHIFVLFCEPQITIIMVGSYKSTVSEIPIYEGKGKLSFLKWN